ncbi:hypothetical protein F5141DRAFT_495825 [Pisolithus sp. B1]|nr:hypothetical protein F5141DRAFT_495825 [Pisolithus sp. B1]
MLQVQCDSTILGQPYLRPCSLLLRLIRTDIFGCVVASLGHERDSSSTRTLEGTNDPTLNTTTRLRGRHVPLCTSPETTTNTRPCQPFQIYRPTSTCRGIDQLHILRGTTCQIASLTILQYGTLSSRSLRPFHLVGPMVAPTWELASTSRFRTRNWHQQPSWCLSSKVITAPTRICSRLVLVHRDRRPIRIDCVCSVPTEVKLNKAQERSSSNFFSVELVKGNTDGLRS